MKVIIYSRVSTGEQDTTNTYNRWRKNEVPEDIRVESLTDEQMRDLDLNSTCD